jgi:uncharacterized protein involved in cysteine biosynthesis
MSWAVVAGLGWVLPETVSLPWLGDVGFVDNVVSWAAVGVMLVLSAVLMVPVAAIVVGFFLDDIAAAVEVRHYPGAGALAELPVAVQVADSVRFFGVLVAANLAAFVVYLALPPFAPLVFWAVNGYLLGREYFQLVAMRRLGPAGAAALRRRHGARVWLAGVLMAIPLTVPVVNLVVPVLGVAVFTHQFHRLVR